MKPPNKKQPTKMYSFRMPDELLKQVKEIARKNFTSASQIIKQALIEFLDRREPSTKALLNEIEDMPYATEFAKQTDAAMKGK